MTPLMPEVHVALRDAARRRARPHRPNRIPRRAGLLAVLVVLAGGSAIAATAWRPQLGADDRGHPTVAASGVPDDQVAALGVLRRAQTDADRGPYVEAALRMFGGESSAGIHVDGVRRLARNRDGAVVLVPMQRMGGPDPASIRRDVLCVMQYRSGPGAGGSGGGSCGTVADLWAGRIGADTDVGRPRVIHVGKQGLRAADLGPIRRYGLVPDRVARVELTLRDDTALTAMVHDNAFELDIAQGYGQISGDPRDTRWLDRAGREVHRRWRP